MRFLLRLSAVVLALCGCVLAIAITLSLLRGVWSPEERGRHRDHIAVVQINGVIYTSGSFVHDVQELLKEKSVKGLVVRINSPGGLVGPSQEMYDVLKSADKKIPVVASMAGVAASGGYYAALGARKIFSNPGTLTASIGVIMEFANTERLYEWAKVERFALKAGKLKDVGSPTRKMEPHEKEFLQALLNDVHGQFKKTVQENRKLSPAELEAATDGRVMTGQQALAAKLVDQMGGLEEAIAEAKRLAKLPEDAPVTYPESKRSLFKTLIWGDEEGGETSKFERAVDQLSQYVDGLTSHTRFRIMLLSSVEG